MSEPNREAGYHVVEKKLTEIGPKLHHFWTILGPLLHHLPFDKQITSV